MGFAKPIGKYAIPYFFFTLLHAVFNVFNYTMLIPILNVLFPGGDGDMSKVVTAMPRFELNMEYLKDLINYGIYSVYGESYDKMQVLLLMAGILVMFSLLSNLFRYLGARTVENMKINTLERIRNTVFDRVMNFQVGYFSNQRKGDIMARLTSDVNIVQFCITNTLQVIFRDPFLIITYLIMLIAISWQLTIFSALYLPVVALVIGTIVKKLRHKAAAGQLKNAEMVSTLDESLSGVKIIKAYNATDYIKQKYHDINRFFSRLTKSMAKRQQLASPMSEFLGITAMAIMLLFGGNLVIGGKLGVAEFLAYLAMFSQLTRPLRSFVDAFSGINQGIAAGERVLAILDEKPAFEDAPNAIELNGFNDELQVRDVRFSYDSREVICGVSFDVKKGETIALVGPSGGGKSTLSDLIPRFYDVDSGEIIIDGHNIKDYSIESLRANIGVVSQDTILFNDTIEGNIRMGKRDATKEEIETACRIANAHDFIMETEEGYQTNIGDRGMKLSGGQRQRLSIARAVLKNPDILILDEATSALDTESEKLVQDALDKLLQGRTSIVIAHRLSTIYNATKILVVENGHIVERGTHDELIKLGGVYHKLVELQNLK